MAITEHTINDALAAAPVPPGDVGGMTKEGLAMVARRLANGNLIVPRRVETEDGRAGDAFGEVGPDPPEFKAWDGWLRRRGEPGHSRPETRTPRR